VIAVEQAARDFGLVVLTSDHDVQQGSQVLLDAAATNVEEGFELAATDNPTSTLLQVSCCCNGIPPPQPLKHILMRLISCARLQVVATSLLHSLRLCWPRA
jgi:hypothetical protein